MMDDELSCRNELCQSTVQYLCTYALVIFTFLLNILLLRIAIKINKSVAFNSQSARLMQMTGIKRVQKQKSVFPTDPLGYVGLRDR